MREVDLCRELSKKICKDLGCTPFSIGKTSLTHKDLLTKPSLKLRNEKDLVKSVPVWYGEVSGLNGLMCCLLAAIEPEPDNLELACVIGFKDSKGEIQKGTTRAGFRYDWADESDPGTFVIKANDKWLPMTLTQQLQLALGFENMVQDGILWKEGRKVPEEFRKNLSEIIELDN
jgi:hypothetical protein